jgi:hypothetical protein
MNPSEILAACLYASSFIFAAAAIALCVFLFQHTRLFGWLLLAVLFIEPFYFAVIRLYHGGPLLHYRTVKSGITSIHYDIPVAYVCAVLGLFLLAKRVARGKNV